MSYFFEDILFGDARGLYDIWYKIL